MIQETLRGRFTEVGIPLRIAESPRDFDRNIVEREAATLFMIDVRSRRGRSRRQEYILLYCGDLAQVRLLDTSRRHQQALIDVQEPESRISRARWDPQLGRRVEEGIVVPASRRRMVVGMDESHLFICPLDQNASSVEEAHRKLAPEPVRRAGRHQKVKRQGEWFFLKETRAEVLAEIDEAVSMGAIQYDAGISAAGRPHHVGEFVRLASGEYARGTVRHPDHRTLQLKTWHRVYRNTERVDVRPRGMTWVD